MRYQLKTGQLKTGAKGIEEVGEAGRLLGLINQKCHWPWRVLAFCVAVTGMQVFSGAAFSSPLPPRVFQEKPDSAPAQSQSSQSSPDSDSQARLEKLVNQLGSPNYAIRQAAAEQIWRFGSSATPALERAVKLGDPEVAKRAQEILTVLGMGIDFETDSELAQLVLRFNNGERAVKRDVLLGLIGEHRLSLVLQLIERVESEDDQRWQFDRVLDFNSAVARYGREGRWDEIELMHQHPMAVKYSPDAVAQYSSAAGTLMPMIETLEQEIASTEKDGKKIELRRLIELISLLRMQQRFEDAQTYIAKIEEHQIKNRFANRVLMEKGDWAAVAEKMAGPDRDATSENGLIEVTDSQRAMVCQFAGDQAGYREAIQDMLKKAEEAKSDGDKETARTILDAVVEIGMINLDWDLVYQHLDFEDVHATFELLIDCRRIDEAFELVGLGDTVEKRDLWFNRKMRYVSSLRKKIERLEKSHGDIDPTNVKINLTWRMSLGGAGIANTLGGLGLVDEATAHYHTMFSNLTSKEDLDHRCDIVQRLFWMGRYEETRTLCKQGFSLSEIDDVAPNVVATQKRAHIRYWMGKLKKRYPDPLKRLHVAAGIVNSPFCGLDDFDLRLELASIEPDPKYVKSGSWDFRLAQVHQFHGDVAKYESHLQIAQQAGYSRAADQDRVKQAVLSENWDQVVEFYDSPPNNTTVYAALLAAEAYRQLGDVQSSALRTAFAFAIWEENYGNSGTTSMLETIEKQHLATNFLKLQVYRGDYDGSTASTERYRSSLADSQLKSDPEAAVNNIRIVLFDYFASNYRRDVTYHWAGEMIKFKTGQAQGLIKEGKLDEALELALQCDKFAPGDPGLGEDLIPAFDEAGGAEQAQQLFEQLSGFYFDLLAKYPESALHHNNYAWLCACAERRKDHMLRHAEIAVEQRPDSSSYLDTLATVYFLIGENEKAIELCRRCIAIYPSKQHYRDQLKRFGGDQ